MNHSVFEVDRNLLILCFCILNLHIDHLLIFMGLCIDLDLALFFLSHFLFLLVVSFSMSMIYLSPQKSYKHWEVATKPSYQINWPMIQTLLPPCWLPKQLLFYLLGIMKHCRYQDQVLDCFRTQDDCHSQVQLLQRMADD